MMAGGAAFAASALASDTAQAVGNNTDEDQAPLVLYLNGVSMRGLAGRTDTLQIDDTLGEQVTCTVTLVNPPTTPLVGDTIEVRYFSHVLFAGTIDRLKHSTNGVGTYHAYECTCTDWSQRLYRHKILRNFTAIALPTLVDSLLDNEVANEGLVLGLVDRGTTIPLVDSKGGSAFDLLREAAGVTGQTLFVGFDKTINFIATTNPAAPLALDAEHVETADLTIDRETYRNVQMVLVKGTLPEGASGSPLTKLLRVENADQIALRQQIEGGSGRYEAYEEVEHPTSNDGALLDLLGLGYANFWLAISGTPRQTLRARVRGYGFRAGQMATLTLQVLGVAGTWLIQRVTVSEEGGKRLVHALELTKSSLQQRAYESWMRIVAAGKITVQMPGALTTTVESWTDPGTVTWTVPEGVTQVQWAVSGGSGSGSYGGGSTYGPPGNGGRGGNAGLGVTTMDVSPGMVFTLVIGAAGALPSLGAVGNAGTMSQVSRDGVVYAQGNGGGGGGYYVNGSNYDYPRPGVPGAGIGDAVGVGSGVAGGRGGLYPGANPPEIGRDGYITVHY